MVDRARNRAGIAGGKERATYGKQVMSDLSKRLAQRYGEGFSVPNLQNFRKFYLAYSARIDAAAPIQYPSGTKSGRGPIQYPAGRELILCSDKTEAVAKYSILSESKQIFASKYMLSLPTEEQLRLEIERERYLIESALEDRADE